VQQATDLPQLAGLYGAALRQHLPNNSPCIIGGVGLGTMVAYELSNQLQQLGHQTQLLIAFESVPISQARLALPALDETVTGELMQVWCALYQLIVESRCSQPQQQQQQQQPHVPELADMIRHLHSLQSYEDQLDFVSTFCPADMTAQAWDKKVHETLSRVLHLLQLLHGYQPREMLRCPALLVHGQEHQHMQTQQGHVRVTDLLSRVADDSWSQIAVALLPITACSVSFTPGLGSGSSVLADAICAALNEAGKGGAVGGKSELHEPCNIMAETNGAVVPLNGLCAENRYYLQPCVSFSVILAAAYTDVDQRNISCLVWLFTALSVIKYLCHILLHYNCYILCHSHTGDLCLLRNLMHMLQVY